MHAAKKKLACFSSGQLRRDLRSFRSAGVALSHPCALHLILRPTCGRNCHVASSLLKIPIIITPSTFSLIISTLCAPPTLILHHVLPNFLLHRFLSYDNVLNHSLSKKSIHSYPSVKSSGCQLGYCALLSWFPLAQELIEIL